MKTRVDAYSTAHNTGNANHTYQDLLRLLHSKARSPVQEYVADGVEDGDGIADLETLQQTGHHGMVIRVEGNDELAVLLIAAHQARPEECVGLEDLAQQTRVLLVCEVVKLPVWRCVAEGDKVVSVLP